jgi:DNA-binding transcriptional LysR family regulator
MRNSAATIEGNERARDQEPKGRVRVSAPDGMAAFWFAPRLHGFLDANPQMAVSMDAGLWPGDPVSDEVELSIQFEETKTHDHVVHKLATVHYVFFAAQSYIEKHGAPATLEDVPKHRMLTHIAYRRQPERWDPKVMTLAWRGKPDFETNSSTAFMAALIGGAGVALAPTYMATMFDNLVPVTDTPSASLSLWLVYQRDAGKIARLRVLIDWLKEICDPAANPWFADEFVAPSDFPGR